MKKSLYILLLLPFYGISQTTLQNFVKSATYIEETTATDETKANVNVAYVDGLGRPIQQIAGKSSGTSKDIITHIEYDEFGRQKFQYLPFQGSSANTQYDPDAKLHTQQLYNSQKYELTSNPYSEQRYERSPLNRVIEQGAPGTSWALIAPLNMQLETPKKMFAYDPGCDNSIHMLPMPVLSIAINDDILIISMRTIPEEIAAAIGLPSCPINTTDYMYAFPPSVTSFRNLPDMDLGIVKDSYGDNTGYKLSIQNDQLVFKPITPGVFPLVKTIDTIWELDLRPFITGESHSVKYGYAANGAVEVKRFAVTFPITTSFPTGDTEKPELIIKGSYGSGQLYKTITKNENWSSSQIFKKDNTTEEFTDKQGRVILKRNFNKNRAHDTYYVYDDYSNLTYVIPPSASDAVLETSVTILPFQHNFAWTKLTAVDNSEAERYNILLTGIANSDILNVDFSTNNFQGRGGFSIIPDDNNNLTLNINITTNSPMPYRTGFITDLYDIGTYPDKELGRISGAGYEYIFSVVGNKIMVDGYGDVPSINTSLTGGYKLEYSKNYPWTKLCETDASIAAQYESDIAGLDNSEILTADIHNDKGAKGGIAVSLDEFDTLTLSMNITSSVPMKLVNGIAFTLDIDRSISDRTLGTISGVGYQYDFSIVDNNLVISGFGHITSALHFFSQPINTAHHIYEQAVNSMCYIYHYDKINRVIEKHIPDNGWTHIVYDRLDRPILTQDENLRSTNYWLFTKYDQFDRVIMTGRYKDADGREAIQTASNDYHLSEDKYSEPSVILDGGFNFYYSEHQAFPPMGELLTIQYYDDYNSIERTAPVYFTLPDDVFGISLGDTKGLPTISHVKVLDGTSYNWINSAIAYDNKGRMIWQESRNSYLGSSDITELKLDFTGKPIETKKTHEQDGTALVVQDFFEYDNVGRMLRQSQTINGVTSQTLAYNHYDELGGLDQKKVGITTTNSYTNTVALQTVDYSYNIRGWLKGINNDANADNDLFEFGIKYNDGGNTPLYNGNIAQTNWRYSQGHLFRYDYTYDALDRLTDAVFFDNGYTWPYHENGISYDKNGNIMSLSRTGLLNTMVYGKTDDLKYIYKPLSNQLLKVTDESHRPEGFDDKNNGADDDYGYDESGNMVTDLNKELGEELATRITYNHLNLPELIKKDASNQIRYIYDATGQKLEKRVISPTALGGVTTIHYANGFVYENNILQYFPHSEGYVRLGTGGFAYIYQYKDHLGNVRLSYADTDESHAITNGEIIEPTDYYPFGMQHDRIGTIVTSTNIGQKIKFQGQERQDELGLNWDSFKWRNYDYAIGRFFNVDPLAEKYAYNGVYNFSENRVVDAVELEGLECVKPPTPYEKEQQRSEAAKRQKDRDNPLLGLVRALVDSFSEYTPAKRKQEAGQTVMNSVPGLTPAKKVLANYGKKMNVGQSLQQGLLMVQVGVELASFGEGLAIAGEGLYPAVKTASNSSKSKVYRVFGGDAQAAGYSWTPENPLSVSSFRDAAGLPSGGASGATNTGQFVIEGTVNTTNIIRTRSALPLDGNAGGLPEWIIDPNDVKINRVSGANPKF